MAEARKNIIVSHGGKHGPTSTTYLRGQRIGQETDQHVPRTLKMEDAALAPAETPPPAPKAATPAGPPVAAHPGDSPAAPVEPAQSPQVPAAEAKAPVSSRRRSATLPNTRKGIQRLDRAQAVAFARDALGLEVPEAMPLEEIHERLVKGLSIE